MKNLIIIFICCTSIFACNSFKNESKDKVKTEDNIELNSGVSKFIYKDNKTLELNTIAFGSCNHQNDPQNYWQSITANRPDLWIWLGDNIYADTQDMIAMKGMYDSLKMNHFYKEFYKNIPLIGVWDDHDYGTNDGDKNYPQKKVSRDLMLEFLDVPKENPVWQREGAYSAYTFGTGEKKVKIILLDARYFRDTLEINDQGEDKYVKNETGDILGEAQWKWFENELNQSDAKLILIGCGIQMLPEEQGFEKWGNFPKARKQLLETLSASGNENIILLSGDRHISEISKTELEGIKNPVYEFTSSGLTHTWSEIWEEHNKYRVGELIINKSFGIIKINWEKEPLEVIFEMRDPENKLLQDLSIVL